MHINLRYSEDQTFYFQKAEITLGEKFSLSSDDPDARFFARVNGNVGINHVGQTTYLEGKALGKAEIMFFDKSSGKMIEIDITVVPRPV